MVHLAQKTVLVCLGMVSVTAKPGTMAAILSVVLVTELLAVLRPCSVTAKEIVAIVVLPFPNTKSIVFMS